MSSLSSLFVKRFISTTKYLFFKRGRPIQEYRDAMARFCNMVKLPEGVEYREVDCHGTKAVYVTPDNVDNENIILYFHGGGYAMGSIETHKPLVGRIAKASATKALLIDYRLAPENPYPNGLDDAIKSYRWLLNGEGYTNDKVIFAGDSAGGGMTVASMLRLKQEGQPLPLAGICLSPWLDLEATGKSATSKAKEDPMIDLQSVKEWALMYAPKEKLTDPLVSPLYGDLSGLPSLYLQVGSAELLLDDSTRLAEKAKNLGVEVEIEVWDDMIHVWQAFGNYIPESVPAIEKIGKFIRSKFSLPELA